MQRFFCACLLILSTAALGIGGCDAARSDLGLVSGTVTLDGRPLANAQVEFSPKGTGSVAYGRTDDSGRFSLMFSRDVEGASIGANVVRISTGDVADQGGREVVIPEKVPQKYNRKSELQADVKAGANTFDFALESAGGKLAQPRIER